MPGPVPKEKRRILRKSTPALRIHGHFSVSNKDVVIGTDSIETTMYDYKNKANKQSPLQSLASRRQFLYVSHIYRSRGLRSYSPNNVVIVTKGLCNDSFWPAATFEVLVDIRVRCQNSVYQLASCKKVVT